VIGAIISSVWNSLTARKKSVQTEKQRAVVALLSMRGRVPPTGNLLQSDVAIVNSLRLFFRTSAVRSKITRFITAHNNGVCVTELIDLIEEVSKDIGLSMEGSDINEYAEVRLDSIGAVREKTALGVDEDGSPKREPGTV